MSAHEPRSFTLQSFLFHSYNLISTAIEPPHSLKTFFTGPSIWSNTFLINKWVKSSQIFSMTVHCITVQASTGCSMVHATKAATFWHIHIVTKHLLNSSYLSVCTSVPPSVHSNSMSPTGWIYVKFDNGDLYKNLSRKCDFGYGWTNILGILCEDPSTFHCCSNTNFPLKCCCATLNIFLLLAVICSSTIHGEYCHISIATMFTHIPQYYVICVHCLACFFLFSGALLWQKWACSSHLITAVLMKIQVFWDMMEWQSSKLVTTYDGIWNYILKDLNTASVYT